LDILIQNCDKKDLTNLENWEKTWQMKPNPDTCYVIHVSKKKKIPLNLIIYYITQPVDNSKYSGVTIQRRIQDFKLGGVRT
jgi:hypothetical protein